MQFPIVQISWCHFRVVSIRTDHVLNCQPGTDYPHGRKALMMSMLWSELGTWGAPGVLWLDPDIAADPDDLAAMTEAVREHPADMHTAAVKLWPESTGRDTWMWSHRGGSLGAPAATQQEDTPVSYVSTGFLYTPARLLDLAFPAGSGWQWDQVDVGLSEIALQAGIPAHLVKGCRPKHLHF